MAYSTFQNNSIMGGGENVAAWHLVLLREMYGAGVERLRIEHQNFVTPSKKKIEITTIASNYHIEVNPSDCGIYDRVVIQELIKTVASAHQLNAEGQKEFKVVY